MLQKVQQNNRQRLTSFSSLKSFESSCIASDQSENGESEKWPWIEEICSNGDLFYLNSQHNNNQPLYQQFPLKNQNKDGSSSALLPKKLKNIVKRTYSVRSSRNTSQQTSHRRIPHKNGITIHRRHATNNIVRKNIEVKLPARLKIGFIDLENMLGIIAGLDLDPIIDDPTLSMTSVCGNDSVLIQGIIPNSPAALSGEITIGDILSSINGVPVNTRNISSVLAHINSQPAAVLTIEHHSSSHKATTAVRNTSPLCSIVTCTLRKSEEALLEAYDECCAIMLLTFDGKEEQPDSDLLFCYPQNESNKLVRGVRGMFLTLSDIMKDFAGSDAQSSMVLVNGRLVNVCYKKLQKNVFVVASPSERCSLPFLLKTVDEFLHLANLVGCELNKGFKKDVRHFVVFLMEVLLTRQKSACFADCRQIQLATSFYTDVGCVLNDLEGEDYGEFVDDFFPHRRLYHTVGSCLFYKDNLVASHLNDFYMKVVVLFCKYHALFALVNDERIAQLIIWKEVFLNTMPKPEFSLPDNLRWFLLIVGQSHSMLVSLFEAGCVSSKPSGNPGPHPFYVDTAQSTLSYFLQVMDIESVCQSRLNGQSVPATVRPTTNSSSPNKILPRALTQTTRKLPAHLLKHHQDSFQQQAEIRHQQQLNDSSLGDDRSTLSNDSKLLSSMSSDSKMFDTSNHISLTASVSTKLTHGGSNVLFHHLTYKKYPALFIRSNFNQQQDNLTEQLVKTFESSCEQIHRSFVKSKGRLLEKGLLFCVPNSNESKSKAHMQFRVVGRVCNAGKWNEEEIYVCYEDGVAQNIVEMAFKMRFGTYW